MTLNLRKSRLLAAEEKWKDISIFSISTFFCGPWTPHHNVEPKLDTISARTKLTRSLEKKSPRASFEAVNQDPTTVPTQRNVFAKLMKSDEKILSCIPHNSAECFGIRISSHETQRVNRENLHKRANSNQRASSNSAKCFCSTKVSPTREYWRS